MDYTELPRSLIFKDRTNLKDYGVQVYGTMNNYLFTQMRKLTLLRCGNAKEIALQCFNNAYYICTLIQLDEYPDLSMDKYEKNLLEVKIPFPEDVYQASMALVCVLLAAYDDKYKQNDNPLIDSIHHWTSSNKWTGSLCHNSFEDILKACSTDKFTLPKSEFAPRNIIEIIENCSESDLQIYPEFICERLALLKDPRQQMHGADMAIARIKDFQRELCEESEYNPKKDCFKYADNVPYVRDLTWEENVRGYYQQSKEAIDYYTEHYPKNEENDSKEETAESPQTSEVEVLQVTIRNLESKLTHQEKQMVEANIINTEQTNRINELEAEVKNLQNKQKEALVIPDTVTAQQKVRMELARKLMDAAGIDKETLDKWGNKDKAGSLMGTLLDIRPSTCKTYLSDPCMNYEHHKETVDKINPLLEALGLDFKL